MTDNINRRIVLARRPRGLPSADDFRLEQIAVPEPAEGQVLLRTLHLSLDPYMRQMMDELPPLYASAPVGIGEAMPGGTVSRVVASRNAAHRVGDLVLAQAGWQDYALSDGTDLMPLPSGLARPSLALGSLGMPAFTAYVGMLDIGRPRAGETIVVSAATGAVGAAAAQIAKLQGARVVGIAGGREKCRVAVQELGLDACIDRRDARFPELLAAACPRGIDVYFENVGGAVFDAVFPLLNIGARVPVVGTIAHYNDTGASADADRLPRVMTMVLQKRLLLQGLVILDHYATRHAAFQRDMAAWVADGRVKVTEHAIEGLANAPQAFIGMLQGTNVGKLVVRV